MTALIIGDSGIAHGIAHAIAAGTLAQNRAVVALTDTDVLDDPELAARALALLIGDESVELQRLIDVMDSLKASGFDNLSIAARKR